MQKNGVLSSATCRLLDAVLNNDKVKSFHFWWFRQVRSLVTLALCNFYSWNKVSRREERQLSLLIYGWEIYLKQLIIIYHNAFRYIFICLNLIFKQDSVQKSRQETVLNA